MTMPDVAPPRQARPRRIGLWAPFAVLLAALIAWSVYWFTAKGRIERGLDEAAAQMATSGHSLTWQSRTVYGWPFRFDIDLAGVTASEKGGWGVRTPLLKAEAEAFDLTHWVFAAPKGLTVERPGAGGLVVTAPVLRASLTGIGTAPRFSFQATQVAFDPEPGAEPYPLARADLLEIHSRPAPGDILQLQMKLTNAETRRTGLFAHIPPLAPLSLTAYADLDKASAMSGGSWPAMVKAWTAAGGSAEVTNLTIGIGDIAAEAQGGPITVSPDGRLKGTLRLDLKNGARALAAISAAQSLDPSSGLDPRAAISAVTTAVTGKTAANDQRVIFSGDSTTFGPVRLGPSPRVY